MLFWRIWATKQLLVLSDFQSIFFLLLKSMWTSNCLVTHVFKNILFCVQHKERNEYRFGTTCEWVNNDRNEMLGWTIPLMTVGCMFSSVPLRPARIRLSRLFTFILDINQLSLYISLGCFDSISSKDSLVHLSGTVKTGFFVCCSTILWYFAKSRSLRHFYRPRSKIVISHTPMPK